MFLLSDFQGKCFFSLPDFPEMCNDKKCSVSDPYHFDADPDPRIRIRDDGSGS